MKTDKKWCNHLGCWAVYKDSLGKSQIEGKLGLVCQTCMKFVWIDAPKCEEIMIEDKTDFQKGVTKAFMTKEAIASVSLDKGDRQTITPVEQPIIHFSKKSEC